MTRHTHVGWQITTVEQQQHNGAVAGRSTSEMSFVTYPALPSPTSSASPSPAPCRSVFPPRSASKTLRPTFPTVTYLFKRTSSGRADGAGGRVCAGKM